MKRVIGLIVGGMVLLSGGAAFAGADGKAVYEKKCVFCHGADGKKAPGVKFTVDAVKKGKPPKMPAYEGKLSDEEIKAVVDYAAGLK